MPKCDDALLVTRTEKSGSFSDSLGKCGRVGQGKDTVCLLPIPVLWHLYPKPLHLAQGICYLVMSFVLRKHCLI